MDTSYRHTVWLKIAPNGKMTAEAFVRFIVENKIGTGKEIDARNMFKMMDKGQLGSWRFYFSPENFV
jgi:hypothetical protein